MSDFFYDLNDLRFRYADQIASSCGLHTSIEVARCLNLDGRPEIPRHVWRGTAEQFGRLWFLTSKDKDFTNLKKKRWLHPGWLRGPLYREGPNSYRWVIEFGWGLSRKMENKIFGRAHADAGFQRFRAAILTKIELHDEES